MARDSKQGDLRVALIGFGLGGLALHAPLIAATPGLALTTIVTSNADRQAAAQKDFPAARIVPTADDVWSRASEHDLVVITTPNKTHVPLARAAVDARIAVVVDKPMAATAREARELVAYAESNKVPLTAYHNRRWDGELLTAQRLIAGGELGDVVRFESRLDRWRPAPLPNVWRERAAADEAGGLLFDLGPHLIDQARVLFGPVAQVYAELERRRPGVEVHDDVFLALRHASGVLSHLWASSVAAQPGPRMRVMGTRASYVKIHADVQEAALRSGHAANERGFGEDPQDRWGVLGAGDTAKSVPTERGNYQKFYSLAVPWLRDGAPPPVKPDDALAVLDIIEAAHVSASDSRVVRFSPPR